MKEDYEVAQGVLILDDSRLTLLNTTLLPVGVSTNDYDRLLRMNVRA